MRRPPDEWFDTAEVKTTAGEVRALLERLDRYEAALQRIATRSAFMGPEDDAPMRLYGIAKKEARDALSPPEQS